MFKLNKNQRSIIIIAMILTSLVFLGTLIQPGSKIFQSIVYIVVMVAGALILLEGRSDGEKKIFKAIVILACLFALAWGISWAAHEFTPPRKQIQWR